MVWSTVAALLSASLFAGTTNLQRVAASSVAAHAGPLRLVRRLFTDRRWLAGGVIGAAALGLHALALSLGSVMVVQSVMALGLLMALAFEAVRERRRLRLREALGAGLVVGGVSVVVTLSRPAAAVAITATTVLAVCGVVVVAVLATLVRSRHAVGHRWEARLLAAGAGACFAVDAVFLQGLAVAAGPLLDRLGVLRDGHGPQPNLVAVVIGLVGFFGSSAVGGVAAHRAYQVAPLRSVQPALAAAEPVTAFLLGVGVLGEAVIGGVAGFVLLVGGFVAITVGIVVGLSGSVLDPGDHDDRRAGRAVPGPGASLTGAASH